jgi:hypothetical protein
MGVLIQQMTMNGLLKMQRLTMLIAYKYRVDGPEYQNAKRKNEK